jgi:hypothetical protein
LFVLKEEVIPALGVDAEVDTEPVRSVVKPDEVSMSSGSSMNMKGEKTILSKKHWKPMLKK